MALLIQIAGHCYHHDFLVLYVLYYFSRPSREMHFKTSYKLGIFRYTYEYDFILL